MERRLGRSLVGAGRELMSERKSTTPRVTLTFTDDSSVTLRAGAFSQIAAKRWMTRQLDGNVTAALEALRAGDPEVILFASWIELHGPSNRTDEGAAFEKWLHTVESIEMADEEEDPEDPTPADPSDSWPASPPTSE